MKARKIVVLLCMLALLLDFTSGERAVSAETALEMEVEQPPLVALTFDDGPRKDTTGPLLEGLALREVPATFFLVGNRLEGCQQLVQEMASQGHQIGMHTFDHVMLRGLSREEFDGQVERTRGALGEILGEGEFWLRPPYGIFDRAAVEWSGSPLILWSVDPEDWRDKNKERIVSEILGQVKDGDIILMHDIYHSSVEAALQVVDSLLERGFCFVTVEQMMRERQEAPAAGKVYRRFPVETSP